MNKFNKQDGVSVTKFSALVPLVLIGLLVLAYVFTFLNKAYWDYRVKHMCEKDGGVQVYEMIFLTPVEVEHLGRVSGYLTVGPESKARVNAPAYTQDNKSTQRFFSLRVDRHERVVIRSSDQKTVGKIISYARVGGDFPDGFSATSSYSCPESPNYYKDQESFFTIVNGNAK